MQVESALSTKRSGGSGQAEDDLPQSIFDEPQSTGWESQHRESPETEVRKIVPQLPANIGLV
jgi:hypothetical protein